MDGPDTPVPGQVPTPQYLQELDSLRKLFDPQAAMDRLETYGKWLFGSSTVIAGLGAGLSNTSLSKLRGPGIATFALAVGMFGVALVFASLSMAPHWAKINLNSLDSMLDAFNNQFASRQRVLKAAATAFAFALLLAALSPLASLAGKESPALVNYAINDKNELDATLEAFDLKPGEPASLRLESVGTANTTVAIAEARADNSGHVKIELKKPGVTSLPGSVDLISCVGQSSQSACPGQRFHLK